MTAMNEPDQQRFIQAFGAGLRQRRLARGWSQAELAERARLHPKLIAAVERGVAVVHLDQLAQLARAFVVEPAELLPPWEAFTDQADNPRHQEAMRGMRELLAGEAAGMPPLTPNVAAHLEELAWA